MIKIHSFRAGFATNSSSSHSVILLGRDDLNLADIDADNDYHWNNFRLVSQEAKLRYLAAQLIGSYLNDKNAVQDVIDKIKNATTTIDDTFDKALFSDQGWNSFPTVDHQSQYSVDGDYNPAFTDFLIKVFSSPAVAVLGGNDNSEGMSMPAGAEAFEPLNSMRESQTIVRQDDSHWTFFRPYSGNKVRMSFGNAVPYEVNGYSKSRYPELVDLKITQFCNAGCSFCYMGSTAAGKHAPFERIEKIVNILSGMKVFEVAIGGGEPTTHPRFADILRLIKSKNMVPNFTTYSDKWLENKDIVDAVNETVGGIGVSCLSAKDIDMAKLINDKTKCKVMAQHVFGSVPMFVTTEFLNVAFAQYIHVLLLGFKEVGFGRDYERHDTDSAETFICLGIEKAQWPRLSIDTALNDRYPTLAKNLGAPNALVASPEGKFSCYVDAVENGMAASSYTPDGILPMAENVDEFEKVYATF